MATTTSIAVQLCDVGDHPIDGEVFEARTGNWLVPGDMVCVMAACEEHAELIGAHPRSWWKRWLAGEGSEQGYTSLS